MGFKTKLFSQLLQNSISIPTEVTYWDGSKETIGEETADQVKIRINSEINWKDIQNDASVALAEAYMDRVIEFENPYDLQRLIVSVFQNQNSFLQDNKFIGKIFSKHDKKTSEQDIQHHYDLGNDFYEKWLDDSMTYSCAYFKNEDDTLEQAQTQKIDHIFNKLRLTEEDHLLDIGCGWGDLIILAAEKYGLKATGCTLSQEQYNHVSERIKEQGLEGQVEVKLQDYRDLPKDKQKFTKIASVGMLEHVGKENVKEFYEIVNKLLEEKGLALIHNISGQRDMFEEKKGSNAFLNKYIFPGGYIPSLAELINSINQEGMHLVDLESLRRHYQLTLEEWHRRFYANWEIIAEEREDRFMRMWDVYLQACAAIFEAGNIDVDQYLIEKGTDNTRPLTRDYML